MNIASDGQNRYPGVIFVSSTLYDLYQTGAKWDEEEFEQVDVGSYFQGWMTKDEALQIKSLKTLEEINTYLDQVTFFGMLPEDFEIWINSLHWFN